MREDDPGPKYSDWFRTWGVIILAVYVSVFAFGLVDLTRFFVLSSLGQWADLCFRNQLPPVFNVQCTICIESVS